MRNLEAVRKEIEGKRDQAKADVERYEAELDQLSDEKIQKGFDLALTYAQSRGTTTSSTGTEDCPIPGCGRTGFKRVARHIGEKHPDEYDEWQKTQ